MELFQELVFTISFSLIVCLLIAKLFSISSNFDGGNSTLSIRVEEKTEKEWVVCDPGKEGKSGCFEDPVKGREEVDFEFLEGELGSGVVIDGTECGSRIDACYVFDENSERTESNAAADGLVKSDEGNVVNFTGSLVKEDCVKSIEVKQVMKDTESGNEVGACYVFDERPEKTESNDADTGLVKSDECIVVNFTGSLVKEDYVKSIEVKQVMRDTESGNEVGACYVFDERPEKTESNDADTGLVKSDEGIVVNFSGSLVKEDCVKSIEVKRVMKDTESGNEVGACYVFDESPERTESNRVDAGLVKSVEGNAVNFTGSLVEKDCIKSVEVEHVSSAIADGEVKVEEDAVFDDDWQGIETTDLEKRFGAAVAFINSKINTGVVNLIDNEVKIQLYGLHRVAIEGSCFEPQPMALKVSARANWNSWKRLENLGREDAMEQYIALLSQHVPGWMGSHSSDKQ